MSLFRLLPLLFVLLASAAAGAADRVPAEVESAIRAQLGSAMKGVAISSVSASPIAGLYEVVLDGAETAFVSADGQYLVSGDLYQAVGGRGLVNLTEQNAGKLRRAALARMDRAQFISFPAKGQEKAAVWVFTDIDCGYCRKLHQEIPQTNAAGITVHYLAFPRAGLDSDTAHKMDAVWCAVDRQKALTDAKRGVSVPPPPALCKSPVADQYRAGVSMGVRGTPAVFDSKGNQLGGYLPSKELAAKAVASP